jgi:hypothetical protein
LVKQALKPWSALRNTGSQQHCSSAAHQPLAEEKLATETGRM